MPTLIHPDQTGLIKGHHSFNNTLQLFNIIINSTKQQQQLQQQKHTVIISLNAEKAFDKVNW